MNENLSPAPERGEVVTFGDNGNYFSARFNNERIFITAWDAPLDNHLGTWTFELLNGREPDAFSGDYAPLGIVVMDSSVGGNLLVGFGIDGPAYFIELEMTNGLPTGNVLRFFSLVHDITPLGTPTSTTQAAGFLMQRKPDGSIIVAGRAVDGDALQQAFFTFNATATDILQHTEIGVRAYYEDSAVNYNNAGFYNGSNGYAAFAYRHEENKSQDCYELFGLVNEGTAAPPALSLIIGGNEIYAASRTPNPVFTTIPIADISFIGTNSPTVTARSTTNVDANNTPAIIDDTDVTYQLYTAFNP